MACKHRQNLSVEPCTARRILRCAFLSDRSTSYRSPATSSRSTARHRSATSTTRVCMSANTVVIEDNSAASLLAFGCSEVTRQVVSESLGKPVRPKSTHDSTGPTRQQPHHEYSRRKGQRAPPEGDARLATQGGGSLI